VAKIGLGKGINALIPDIDSGDEAKKEAGPVGSGGERLIELDRIKANPDQPRRSFDDETLKELADSVRRHGVIQPILVEEDGSGGYRIIAGERRYRAATLAGLRDIPALVRSVSPEKRLEVALIENIQREDLNPVDEALAYRQLMDLTGASQEEVASRVGKNRSTVANALRLLKLPPQILEALKSGSLTPGHARAILSVVNPADQEILFKRIVADSLSVRDAGRDAGRLNSGDRGSSGGAVRVTVKAEDIRAPELREIEEGLIGSLGTKVAVKGSLEKGSIEISYFSMDDLERIFRLLKPGQD
jgi:ParB family transcriptional regulator, chromosome partitioning protein